MSCWHCFPVCPTGVGTRGKFVLSNHKGVNGPRRPVPGAPSSGTRGKLFLSSSRGLMGTRDLCRVPPAAVRHGRGVRQRPGTVPCGDCRRVLWGQYSRKIRFIEKSGVQDEGVFMWLNIVLNDTQVAYP